MGVDQGVEIGHHIPFNVVLPCDHAPGFAGLHRCHDARHVRRGHELRLVDAILRFQATPGFDGRLMGKGAFRPKIGQLHMRHTHHRSVCPPGMPAIVPFWSGDVRPGHLPHALRRHPCYARDVCREATVYSLRAGIVNHDRGRNSMTTCTTTNPYSHM